MTLHRALMADLIGVIVGDATAPLSALPLRLSIDRRTDLECLALWRSIFVARANLCLLVKFISSV